MDKLEEIKALRNDAGFYANITIHNKATEQVDWLISEIERLRKALEDIKLLSRDDLIEAWTRCLEIIEQALKESE